MNRTAAVEASSAAVADAGWAARHAYGSGAAPPGEAGPPLSELLGARRAAVLAALDLPVSTTTLARQLGVPAPTVSHHLSVLRRCRLVASRRSGREVLYRRTELGTDLMGR